MRSRRDSRSKRQPRPKTPSKLRRERINKLAETFVREVENSYPDIHEGIVMSSGQPYRRLDCDTRALAYLRERPRRDGLRIDISGLWYPRGLCALSIPGSVGCASLMVHDEDEIEPAIWFLVETVEHSRTMLRDADDTYLQATG